VTLAMGPLQEGEPGHVGRAGAAGDARLSRQRPKILGLVGASVGHACKTRTPT
jgi:hypothetical protein